MKVILKKTMITALGISVLFMTGCSSKSTHTSYEWCDDIYKPGTKFYKKQVAAQKKDHIFEIPPVITPAFLPKKMQKTHIYKLDKNVYSDGFMDHYTIITDWGKYRIGCTSALKRRLNEMVAIDALKKVSSGGAAIKGVAGSVAGLVMTPFSIVGSIIKKKPEDETLAIVKESQEDPAQKHEVEKHKTHATRYGNIVKADSSRSEHIAAVKNERQGEGLFSGLIGYSSQVSELQQKFGIDPDSDNDVLRAEIQRVARSQTGGGLTTSLIPGTTVLTIVSGVNKGLGVANSVSLYADEKTKKRLIHERLTEIGVSEDDINAFQEAAGMTSQIRTEITNSILYMRGLKGRSVLVQMAASIDDEEIIFTFMDTLRALVKVYDGEHLVRLIDDAPGATAVTADNRVIAVLGADHLYWTKNLKDYMDGLMDAIKDDGIKPVSIEIRFMAILSDQAKKEVAKYGVKVTEIPDEDKYNL